MIRSPDSRPVVLRTGLILLATFNTIVGVWLLVSPDSPDRIGSGRQTVGPRPVAPTAKTCISSRCRASVTLRSKELG